MILKFLERVLEQSFHPLVDVVSLLAWKHMQSLSAICRRPTVWGLGGGGGGGGGGGRARVVETILETLPSMGVDISFRPEICPWLPNNGFVVIDSICIFVGDLRILLRRGDGPKSFETPTVCAPNRAGVSLTAEDLHRLRSEVAV